MVAADFAATKGADDRQGRERLLYSHFNGADLRYDLWALGRAGSDRCDDDLSESSALCLLAGRSLVSCISANPNGFLNKSAVAY